MHAKKLCRRQDNKPEPQLPQIRFAESIASLAGVALYNTWLKNVPLKKMLMYALMCTTVAVVSFSCLITL